MTDLLTVDTVLTVWLSKCD